MADELNGQGSLPDPRQVREAEWRNHVNDKLLWLQMYQAVIQMQPTIISVAMSIAVEKARLGGAIATDEAIFLAIDEMRNAKRERQQKEGGGIIRA